MDNAFQAFSFSLILHAVLWFLLANAKLSLPTSADRTEITIIDRSESAQSIVTETKPTEDVFEKLKNQADFLSKYTKRVKEQMKARESGPTRNAAPSKVAGLKNQREQEKGIGMRAQPPGSPMRQIAVGSSSVAEHIPGIKAGDFTFLNTDQFTYYAFYERIGEQIRNRWISLVRGYVASRTPQQKEILSQYDRQTVLEVLANPKGEIVDTILHSSSGDRQLDQIMIQAFRAAAPYMNPPQGMVEEDGLIHLKAAFIVRFAPPSFSPDQN